MLQIKSQIKIFPKSGSISGQYKKVYTFFMFVASSGLYSFNTHYYVCSLIQPASLFYTHYKILNAFKFSKNPTNANLTYVWGREEGECATQPWVRKHPTTVNFILLHCTCWPLILTKKWN